MPSAPVFIQAESVSREYRLGEAVIRAVDGVSLCVEKGEFLALLGSSGSGKSTLLGMMAGLDRPTSGAIRVRDRNLAELDKDELARCRRALPKWIVPTANPVLAKLSSAWAWDREGATGPASYPAVSSSAAL